MNAMGMNFLFPSLLTVAFRRITGRVMRLTVLGVVLMVHVQVQDLQARSGAADIGRTIEQKQSEIQTHERLLRGLSEQERQLFGDLQLVEASISKAENEVHALEKDLATLRKTEEEIQVEYKQLDKARSRTSLELSKLLTSLWPVHLRSLAQNMQDMDSWDEADRQFHWLGRVYTLVREKIARLQVQGRELAMAQVRAVAAQDRIAAQMDRVNAAKDELLSRKLEALRRVQDIRDQKASAEEQLKDVLQTIIELNYQLKLLTTKNITDFKGQLPWPGQGTVLEGYRPGADPPHRGLSLAMGEQAPVHAVSWGKVVHSDVLRGYGHVVIIYHGEDYYSLYAFLSDVPVRVGQEVEKGERIASAGYYPKVKGPGLYFELRFHQNPVNPGSWLAAK